jgi:hypothetical protein
MDISHVNWFGQLAGLAAGGCLQHLPVAFCLCCVQLRTSYNASLIGSRDFELSFKIRFSQKNSLTENHERVSLSA